MKTIELSRLGASHAHAVALPGVILAFDPADDPDFRLSAMISARPGVPVVILCTRFDQNVFSLADNTNRTYIFAAADIPAGDVPAGDPVSWLAPGDFIPMIPGGVSVTAIGSGFLVEKLGSHIKVLFSPRADDAETIKNNVDVAIVPPDTIISAGLRADY